MGFDYKKAKRLAIEMRKNSFTYKEILHKIPVSKSTLSLWLRSVSLAKKQFQKLTDKKFELQKRGAAARKKQKVELISKIFSESKNDLPSLLKDHLFISGLTLYWGEGSKEKSYRPGRGLQLINSDPRVIKIYLLWLKKCLKIKRNRISLDIYLHENHHERTPEVILYWSKVTGFNKNHFTRVYKKKHIAKKTRKSPNEYFGILQVNVSKSSRDLRRVEGFIQALFEFCIKNS